MIRRINFYSGPCCGKSVMAANIFLELKKRNQNVELIQEYAKDLAYDKIKIRPYDQLKIFAEQVSREHRVLQSDPDVITVTDSPIDLSISYARKYGFESWQSLVEIARKFNLDYPSINFFLIREDCPYSHTGRYENYEEAIIMDKEIKQFLKEHQMPFINVRYNDATTVLQMIEDIIYS
jgi:hypothetical protein